MSKDVNIHVKTPGAQQAKQELDNVSHSTKKIGKTAEESGTKASRFTKLLTDGLKKLVGPLGIAAIATALATATLKVAKFFDNLKTRCDEAVRNVQNVRKEFADLFEALDAFDEKSRKQVTKETAAILQETSTSKEIGIPVINAYTRQFRAMVKSGQLTEEQYQQGLKGMLGYAERHGGAATSDLIALMAGWGMTTPQQQGTFRRQIAAGAAASGLTDAELIAALGRGMPTIKAMGWSPTQAVGVIATLAAGETGRQKMGLPATTLQGLLAPQEANFAKYGISEQATPQEILAQLQQKRGQMSQQAFTTMLTDIYGTTAAAGVSKLLTTPTGNITNALLQAASGKGAKLEQEEERTSRETLERRDARAKAKALLIDLDIKTDEEYQEDIREIGEKKRTQLRRREPVRQWFREVFQLENTEKERAAYREWMENLSPEEKEEIRKHAPEGYIGVWQGMSPREQYEALTRQRAEQPPTTINYEVHYHNDTIHQPTVGSQQDRNIGPRMPSGAY